VLADDLERILQVIDSLIREGVAFGPSDSNATIRQVRLLTSAACLMNERLIARYGGHPGDNRGVDLVEQVVGAAFQTFGGEESHPDPFEKAAILLRGITQGHPFGDGNKRTGFALAAYYLNLVGLAAPSHTWGAEAVTEFCIAVSAGEIRDIPAITERLRQLWGVSG
jgi:prophage maintenance system killer protein